MMAHQSAAVCRRENQPATPRREERARKDKWQERRTRGGCNGVGGISHHQCASSFLDGSNPVSGTPLLEHRPRVGWQYLCAAGYILTALYQAGLVLVPVLAALFVFAFASQALQVGFMFTGESIMPKFSASIR